MTNHARLLAVVALGTLLAAPAAAQTDTTERFTKTVHLDERGTFDLTNIAGDIVVTAGRGRDVTIEAIKRVQRPRPNAARALLQMITIQVVEQANRVEVRTLYPRPRNFPGAVDYTVSVPEDTSVTIKTIRGNARISHVRGELRADVVVGDIVVTDVGMVAALKCVTGNIQIDGARADGLVSASTVSGGITVQGLEARAIQLGSVSGDLRIEGSRVDRVTMRAVQGSLDYNGELAKNGRYEFASHSGDIRLMLSGSTGFALQANSFSGSVRSDFVLGRRGGEGDAPAGRGPRGVRAVRGTFGDASAMLILRAFAGNITIARR